MGLGYQKLIITPHVMSDHYPNTPTTIQRAEQELRNGLAQNNLNIELEAAAEYLLDDHFKQLLKQRQLLTFADQRVLVEMSFFAATPGLHELFFEMQTQGYKPILAHPERYLYYRTNFDQYYQLKAFGCQFQLNILSLTGYYGRPIRELAWKLLKNNLIDYLGSDMHHAQHASKMAEALSNDKVQKLLQEYPFQNNDL